MVVAFEGSHCEHAAVHGVCKHSGDLSGDGAVKVTTNINCGLADNRKRALLR